MNRVAVEHLSDISTGAVSGGNSYFSSMHLALVATADPDRLYRTFKLQEWRYPKSND
jgi:hypothetical protein